ncbi:MAG: hypothetical protein WC676_01480 [Candidatus Omnitrophota bacterium]
MLKKLRQMKAQSTLEYAVLIIIIIGALLSIQFYIKRGVQGRLRSAADDIGEQFSPGNTRVNSTTSSTSSTRETFNAGVTRSELTEAETVNVDSETVIINQQQEYWGN